MNKNEQFWTSDQVNISSKYCESGIVLYTVAQQIKQILLFLFVPLHICALEVSKFTLIEPWFCEDHMVRLTLNFDLCSDITKHSTKFHIFLTCTYSTYFNKEWEWASFAKCAHGSKEFVCAHKYARIEPGWHRNCV